MRNAYASGAAHQNPEDSALRQNTQMRWQRRYAAIDYRRPEETFSLIEEEEAEYTKGVHMFKYIRRMLERSDNSCPAVLRNIRKVRQVWGRLGKLLRSEVL